MTRSLEAQLKGTTDKELAIDNLLNNYLGDTPVIYTIVRSVSSTGMTRHISLKVAQGGEIYDITYSAALALGERLYDKGGYNTIKQNGTGMDMCFNLVYNLSSVLYAGRERAGYVIKQRAL